MAQKEQEPASSNEKKEKVLHTRVPDDLDNELKARASHLGMSVSNLVRNILNNAVNLVEDVIIDSSNIGRPAVSNRRSGAEGSPPAVVGWQKVILNRNAVCSQCNEILERGVESGIGVTVTGEPGPVLCLTCLEEVTR